MFNNLLNWVLEIINKFGLWGVFFGSIVEEVIAPIPSPIVMMSAGAALLGKYTSVSGGLALDMTTIALVGGIGALIGSYLMYFIGYYGGKPLIDKTAKFTGVSWSAVEKLQSRFNTSSRDEITITTLRAIPVMPSVLIAISCGLMRINIMSYSVSFFIGGIIRNFIFLIVGWQLGSAYVNGANAFESVTDWVTKIIAVGILGVVAYLYWRRSRLNR